MSEADRPTIVPVARVSPPEVEIEGKGIEVPEAGEPAPTDDERTHEAAFLPQISVSERMRERDPQLYEYWREHVRQGFQRNDEMFCRILKGFMRPYYITITMYATLFAVGVLSFVAAAGLSLWFNQPLYGLIFGGLTVAAFLSFFISRPLRALEENLNLITWLGIVYNTYWTRLLYLMDQPTVQKDLQDAAQDAIKDIEHLLDKYTELTGQRPGPR